MFGKKKRIIETQKALLSDLMEECLSKDKIIIMQRKRIQDLVEEVNSLKTILQASKIDFPNSQKGGLTDSGEFDLNDIFFK